MLAGGIVGNLGAKAVWLIVAATLVAASTTTRARADEPSREASTPLAPDLEDARRLFREAVDKDRALDPAARLVLYQQARAKSPSRRRVLFNIGELARSGSDGCSTPRSRYRAAEVEATGRHNAEVAAESKGARRSSRGHHSARARQPPRRCRGHRGFTSTDAPSTSGRSRSASTRAIIGSPPTRRTGAASSSRSAPTRTKSERSRCASPRSAGGEGPRSRSHRLGADRHPRSHLLRPPSYVPAINRPGAATIVLGTTAGITFAAGRAKKDRYDGLNAGPTPGTESDRQQLKDDGEALYVTSHCVRHRRGPRRGRPRVYWVIRAATARTQRAAAPVWVAPSARAFRLGGSF